MSFVVSIFAAWIVIILVCLIPKKLSEKDMVILYFFNTIFVVSTLTILNLNVRYLTVSRSVEKVFAVFACQYILIPLLLVISANVLMYASKWLKWGCTAAIVVGIVLFQKLLESMGVLFFNHWNLFYSLVMAICFVLLSRFISALIHRVREEAKAG